MISDRAVFTIARFAFYGQPHEQYKYYQYWKNRFYSKMAEQIYNQKAVVRINKAG